MSESRNEPPGEPPGEHQRLDDDLVAMVRKRIGQPTSRSYPPPHITLATPDVIRHWAYGTGDYNPLYLDEAYAAASPHGGLIAPPSMGFVFSRGISGGVTGLPGIHALISETRFTWYRQIRPGDRLSGNSVIADVRERTGKYADRQLELVTEGLLRDSAGEVVVKVQNCQRRMERSAGHKGAKYAKLEPHRYSDDELEKLWAAAADEKCRGALPRHFESVAPGDAIDPIVRGPLTTSDIIMFLIAWGGQYIRAHGDWVRWARRFPKVAIRNALNIPQPPEAVHWDDAIAQQTGVPAAYDYGPQRFAWMATALTNWMGDAGMLRTLGVQFRRHVFVGDAVWIRGQVTATRREQDAGLVGIALEARNQADELVATGEGEVALPLRAAGGGRGR